MGGFDAIVLAGGRARRLGGIDKPALEMDGMSMLDRALEAASDAVRVIVVGEERPVRGSVEWVVEDPPGGGPAAALAAGMKQVGSDRVLVLAADLPFVDRSTVHRLVAAAGARGAIAVDDAGVRQPLLAVYETDPLRRWLDGCSQRDRALRGVIGEMDPLEVGVGRAALDCDTWDDVVRAQVMLRG